MLEPNEPTGSTSENADPTAATPSTSDAPAPAKRAPRKRAPKKAVAPAAPPGADADTLTDATAAAAAEQPAADAPAAAPAKRAPRKRAPKKAVAPAVSPRADADTLTDATAATTGDEPTAEVTGEPATEPTAPKRRRARKAAAPVAEAAEVAEPEAAESETSADETVVDEAAAPAGAPAVLFVAPSAEKPAARRRRKATAPAGPPAVEDGIAEDGTAKGGTAKGGTAKGGTAKGGTAKGGTAKGGTAKRKNADQNATDETAEEPEAGDVDLAVAEGDDLAADPEDVREAAIEEANGARRRRRRGRRGRGGNRPNADADGIDDATDATDATDAGDEPEDEAADEEETEGEGSSSSARRRRRRRRSSGSADSTGEDDPPNTVTHVREARDDDDGVRGVKGSTRLEARRQRRRDGRETNRRRPPILTESEFLARREAVDRVMAVRQTGDRTQIAVLEDDILVEHYVTRASSTSYVGNVYLGRVQNVLPSMEAAFVDIGKGRNGVLYAGEVNWDAAGLEGKSRAIENALKSGDTVLVQVTKDPIGHKGARLTSQISLPGRFLVYVPGGGMTGISRRLPDTERHRLKSILKKIVPEDAGVIVRTAAEGASEEDLTQDVERLQAEWKSIEAKAKQPKNAPVLLHGEPDIAIRVVRDVFNEDFKKLIVQGAEAWATISDYISGVAPDLAERASVHVGKSDLFHDLRVDEQLMKGLDRKVWLPSGGSLVIDRTEAMTVIDVNTGKFVGSGGNLEQTVTRNNLEAAEEIVRQLRLRDVGGIVVIDFIDMVLESNRDLVLRRLTECLGRDRTKHQVAEVTSLGLVQMTRKRVGEGLLEAFSDTCPTCHGRGVLLHTEPVDHPSGGQTASSEDDERTAGAGKSRRRRGKKNGAETAEDGAAVDPAQRQKALAAMTAIHKAAHPDDFAEDGSADDLEQEAVAAVLASSAIDPELLGSDELTFDARPAEEPQPEPAEPIQPAEAVEPVETDAVAPVAVAAAAAPARRGRRRAASRPAGPPAGAEAAVIVEAD